VVIAGVKREWAASLAHLTGLVEAGARGPAWLWQIRIRILSYLLARYGEPVDDVALESEAKDPEADEVDVRDAFREPADWPPPPIPTVQPPAAVEHPPKPGTVITPILADIHKVNTDIRFDRWEDPPAEQVWNWWQEAWCRVP
jgi:hypothetical protein